eukprot:TRINITY_DN11836_c0_g1_i1.p1 TRINITY_DN11836_c0_g1~~TRINITY_DN11836_c0_g1_i1.p1  ORF type:complete len:499 (-),score=69.96 TRINITY_DN11836_c0_g1_i1:207-1676(-)
MNGAFPSADLVKRDLSRVLDAVIKQADLIRESQNTPGMSIVVTYKDEIILAKGLGYANQNTKIPADIDTIWRLGSISKVFVALTMMELRDRGALSLDDEVVKHVPQFKWKKPSGSWWSAQDDSRGITFRQLSTHLAGIPSNNPYHFPLDITNAEAFTLLSNVTLLLPTDTMPIYSNLGFNCLGNALAEVYSNFVGRKVSFNDTVSELVLAPLGLTSTSAILTPSQRNRVAASYLPNGQPCGEACLSDWGWEDPCGSFFSSGRDIAKLLMRFLDSNEIWPRASPQTTLGPSMSREMMLPRYINSDKASGFAIPFELYWAGHYLIRTKRGDDNGWSAEMVMIPELKLGIIVNVNMVENSAEATQQIINTLIPVVEAAIRIGQGESPQPANWKDYVGTYSNSAAGGSVSISYDGRMLYISSTIGLQSARLGWDKDTDNFQLLPMLGDQWSCLLTEVEQEQFQWAEFHRDKAGNIATVVFPSITGYATAFARD